MKVTYIHYSILRELIRSWKKPYSKLNSSSIFGDKCIVHKLRLNGLLGIYHIILRRYSEYKDRDNSVL
ncbi:MAG: hypothetical protein QXI24_00410 [Acidilobaceae archaeon]